MLQCIDKLYNFGGDLDLDPDIIFIIYYDIHYVLISVFNHDLKSLILN